MTNNREKQDQPRPAGGDQDARAAGPRASCPPHQLGILPGGRDGRAPGTVSVPPAPQAPCGQAGRAPARPAKDGVVAVLQDEEQRYLLIRRGWKLVRAPGVWCFPGGEVEAGESLAQAIEREMMEELGIEVVAGAKIHESISPNGEYLLHWLCVEKTDPGAVLHPSPDEVAETAWLHAGPAQALEPILPTLLTWLKGRS